MKNFMVRMTANINEERIEDLIDELKKENIYLIHFNKILPDFIIVQTDKTLQELKDYPKFKSVELEPKGTLNV